jgi:hypothetical protein
VLTSKVGVRESIIFWREDGSVYSIVTGTPKKVSVGGLRGLAAGDRSRHPGERHVRRRGV